MNHYVYYSYEEWGRGYIGVRSCKCKPEEDVKYFGSFKDKTFKPKEKIIISTFSSRGSALLAEIKLHAFFDVSINPYFANKSKQIPVFALPVQLFQRNTAKKLETEIVVKVFQKKRVKK